MGFLRRVFGGGGSDRAPADGDTGGPAPGKEDADAEERAHELELARFEQERTDDLVRRQQLYADRSWTPPAQGGERRAEDSDPPS